MSELDSLTRAVVAAFNEALPQRSQAVSNDTDHYNVEPARPGRSTVRRRASHLRSRSSMGRTSRSGSISSINSMYSMHSTHSSPYRFEPIGIQYADSSTNTRDDITLHTIGNTEHSCNDITTSGLKLQIITIVKSTIIILLIIIACNISSRNSLHLWYVHSNSDIKVTIITSVVSIFSSLVTYIHTSAFTDLSKLATIASLNRNGKFGLTASQWCKMATRTGKFYYSLPSFIVGLTSAALMTILTVVKLDPGYQTYVNLQLKSNTSIDCISVNSDINSDCIDINSGVNVLLNYERYKDKHTHNNNSTILQINNYSFTKECIGYPIDLFSNMSMIYTANNIPVVDTYIETAYKTCAFTLVNNPVKCSWTQSQINSSGIYIISPYTNNVFRFSTYTSNTNTSILQATIQNIEFATLQYSTLSLTDNYSSADSFVCIVNDIATSYSGKWIQSNRVQNSITSVNFVTCATNIELCKPTYSLPNYQMTIELAAKLINTIQAFSFEGTTNQLIESFSTLSLVASSNNDSNIYHFPSSTNFLEDGIGTLFSIILSKNYIATLGSSLSYNTTITGGPYIYSVGSKSKLFIFICSLIVILPLSYISIAARAVKTRIPPWDILNPIEMLAVNTDSQIESPYSEDRTDGIVLRKSDGIIVATTEMSTLSYI